VTYRWRCLECHLTAVPVDYEAEATVLAAVHDRVHHRTARTAVVHEMAAVAA